MAEIRIIKHEAVPKCGSFEVSFPTAGLRSISIGTMRLPTIILESRYDDRGQPQCMATLLDVLGMPRRRVLARFEQLPPGHVPVSCQLFARL
jgi:hypothetical protein